MVFTGLSDFEANQVLAQYGPNSLPKEKEMPTILIFLKQFQNFFTIILFLAAVFSMLQKDIADALLIIAILILNACLSFWQEYKASKEMRALKAFSEPVSRVIRNGIEVEIKSEKLVPGDIIVLEAGVKIPADGFLVQSHSLSVDESALNGESASVYKSIEKDDNAVFFSSTVFTGKALMRVTQTGIRTRFGKTVEHLASLKEEKTPLEVSLNNLARNTGFIILGLALFLFIFNLFIGNPVVESFFTSVALFVAAVPEGLPAVITVILAIGVRKLYAKKTLVRRMSAVESLGATNVICTDKTGTLTKNEMTVKEVFLQDESVKQDFIKTAIRCNNASIFLKDHGGYDILGDTTEGSLLVWGKKEKIDIDALKKGGEIIDEQPFDFIKRTMAVLWQENDKKHVYAKGAPENMIEFCDASEEERKNILAKSEELANRGLRVLLLAMKETTSQKISMDGLSYLGLVGIADSPREGVSKVIETARRAGIEVVMITGDNPFTAKAIADEIGLLRDGEEIVTGDQLDSMSENDLRSRLIKIRIYARTTPEHKIRIVSAFQAIGKVVAVTGDGVNDALALKKSNIGVAMGLTGTDVAKEASDIVLLNDNFATLVVAIEQGRTIYANIVRVVRFLFASNLSEVFVVMSVVLLGFPTPLLTVQLLWINLVSDGLPALGLSATKSGAGIMRQAPRNANEPILNRRSIIYILAGGLSIGLINLCLFYYSYQLGGIKLAREVVFSSIVATQMVFVFIVAGRKNILENKYLLAFVSIIISLQILIISIPQLRAVFFNL